MEPNSSTSESIIIFDPHIHLMSPDKFAYSWYTERKLIPGIIWDESLYLKQFSALAPKYVLSGSVLIEACIDASKNQLKYLEEAHWMLDFSKNDKSIIKAVVPHISVSEGPEGVREFLNKLRDEKGELPKALVGARDNQMGKTIAEFTDPLFYAGVRELGAHGLHFELVFLPELLPLAPKLLDATPGVKIVWDHCGFGGDFKAWVKMAKIMSKYDNLVVKLSAVEEFVLEDGKTPEDYFVEALKIFGVDRCLYGSNWFCPPANGENLERNLKIVERALKRFGAKQADVKKVFCENAKKFYKI